MYQRYVHMKHSPEALIPTADLPLTNKIHVWEILWLKHTPSVYRILGQLSIFLASSCLLEVEGRCSLENNV